MFDGNDGFLGVEGLPERFTRAARALLVFARERHSLVRLPYCFFFPPIQINQFGGFEIFKRGFYATVVEPL